MCDTNNFDKYSNYPLFKELYINYTVQLNSSGKNVHEFHVLRSIWSCSLSYKEKPDMCCTMRGKC